MNKFLRILGVIEVILLVATIILYFATAGANDFSGLVVLYPIYAMFGVGILALVIFIASLGIHSPHDQPKRNGTLHKLLILTIASIPVLYVVSNFTAGYGNSLGIISLLYVCVLGAFIATGYKNVAVDVILYGLLFLLPVLLVIQASNMNDSNIYSISKAGAALLIVTTVIGIVIRFTHSMTVKR